MTRKKAYCKNSKTDRGEMIPGLRNEGFPCCSVDSVAKKEFRQAPFAYNPQFQLETDLMNMLRTTCRRIAPFVLGAFGFVSLYTPMAQAGMISTPDYVEQSAAADAQRQQVQDFLQRDDVRERLSGMGVDPAEAQARVDSLTDQEVADISQRLDTLPAGGDSLVGALVFIFLVLLITDLLGLTDVFPFVKKTAR